MVTSLALPTASVAQGGRTGGEPAAGGGRGSWDVTLARGKTRDIDFSTNVGIWTSVDQSPDGTRIACDLLGHVYRVPATWGEATALTQNAGVSLNFQPRISPDGRSLAFITDRRGQYNLWIMYADGTNQRPVFSDINATAVEPAWTPDGNYVVVRRGGRGGGEGAPTAGGLWMYHKDGGQAAPLVSTTAGGRGTLPAGDVGTPSLDTLPGSAIAGSVFTVYVFPRSTAGTTAPQTAAFLLPALVAVPDVQLRTRPQ
jgi:hypothetical protein